MTRGREGRERGTKNRFKIDPLYKLGQNEGRRYIRGSGRSDHFSRAVWEGVNRKTSSE